MTVNTWEYKTISTKGEPLVEAKLQILGGQGWELISVVNNVNNVYDHFFKRPSDQPAFILGRQDSINQPVEA